MATTVCEAADDVGGRVRTDRRDNPSACSHFRPQHRQGRIQITAGTALAQAGHPAGILFPPALLRRAARYISGAADRAANGGRLPDGSPETARNQLAATLRRDADGLLSGLQLAIATGRPLVSSPEAARASRLMPGFQGRAGLSGR